MSALKYNFNLEKGTFFRRTIKWLKHNGTPYDLNTGWIARMQVRPGYEGTLILDLSTENNRIILQDGFIILFLNQETVDDIPTPTTSQIPFPKVTYYYDLYLYNNAQSIAKRYFYGDFNVRGGITQ